MAFLERLSAELSAYYECRVEVTSEPVLFYAGDVGRINVRVWCKTPYQEALVVYGEVLRIAGSGPEVDLIDTPSRAPLHVEEGTPIAIDIAAYANHRARDWAPLRVRNDLAQGEAMLAFLGS